MNDPIKGQDAILRNGTASEQEPLIDTLASLARTALTDPDGLPDGAIAPENEPSFPESLRFNARARSYAVARLDEIINVLNPAEETTENLAASVRILGRHLAERADVLRSIDADGDERYVEAATDLDNALDLIDSALVALEEK